MECCGEYQVRGGMLWRISGEGWDVVDEIGEGWDVVEDIR